MGLYFILHCNISFPPSFPPAPYLHTFPLLPTHPLLFVSSLYSAKGQESHRYQQNVAYQATGRLNISFPIKTKQPIMRNRVPKVARVRVSLCSYFY